MNSFPAVEIYAPVNLIDKLPAIVYVCEPEPPYRTIYISSALESLGYSVDEWLSEPCMRTRVIHTDDRDRVLREVEEAKAAGADFESEYGVIAADGQIHWVHDLGRFAHDEDGRRVLQGLIIDVTRRRLDEAGHGVGFRGIIRDITARRQTARDVTEIKRLQQQLIQSEKLAALGQLVSGVAHELNNPLTSVLGYTQLLLMRNQLDPHVAEQLEIVGQEADRARRIVRNLLSFSRQHKPSRAEVDLNELLERTLELRTYEMKVNKISVCREPGDIPRVMADEHQLQQVFLNIIINAEQAIESDARAGHLTVRTEMGASNRVRIVIADSGPGVPPHIIEKLFDPFFTTKPVGQGTGLGLSISYGIVKEHDGVIRVESEPGRGARFIIELPVKPS